MGKLCDLCEGLGVDWDACMQGWKVEGVWMKVDVSRNIGDKQHCTRALSER